MVDRLYVVTPHVVVRTWPGCRKGDGKLVLADAPLRVIMRVVIMFVALGLYLSGCCDGILEFCFVIPVERGSNFADIAPSATSNGAIGEFVNKCQISRFGKDCSGETIHRLSRVDSARVVRGFVFCRWRRAADVAGVCR